KDVARLDPRRQQSSRLPGLSLSARLSARLSATARKTAAARLATESRRLPGAAQLPAALYIRISAGIVETIEPIAMRTLIVAAVTVGEAVAIDLDRRIEDDIVLIAGRNGGRGARGSSPIAIENAEGALDRRALVRL